MSTTNRWTGTYTFGRDRDDKTVTITVTGTFGDDLAATDIDDELVEKARKIARKRLGPAVEYIDGSMEQL